MGNEVHWRMRVLVLEDNELMRSVLHTLLSERGFRVSSYPDPEQCPLDKVDNCRCAAAEFCADVLVTDLDMPHIGGLQFIEELTRKGCKIRHLALHSGSLDEEVLARAEALHCRVFVKPEGTRALLEWLDELEAGLQSERQAAPCAP